MTLHQTQQEILNYFRGQEVKEEILSKKAQDEISIYKSLVLNSMEDLVKKFYPHCHKILSNSWREIIKDYLEHKPSRSAIYMELAQNFPDFLLSHNFQTKYTYPSYIVELAIYEWTNIELYNAINKKNQFILNPIHNILNFKFPITQIIAYLNSDEDDIEEIRKTEIEAEKEDLILYRDPESLEVRSFALSVTTLFVLRQLERGKSLDQCYLNFCKRFEVEDNAEIKAQYQNLIEQLKNLSILLE